MNPLCPVGVTPSLPLRPQRRERKTCLRTGRCVCCVCLCVCVCACACACVCACMCVCVCAVCVVCVHVYVCVCVCVWQVLMVVCNAMYPCVCCTGSCAFYVWQVLIERFVGDSSELQMAVLYATQVFCYNHTFPKGEWVGWTGYTMHTPSYTHLPGFNIHSNSSCAEANTTLYPAWVCTVC